jgi:hypothetical protein
MLQTIETMNVIDEPHAVDADTVTLLGRTDHLSRKNIGRLGGALRAVWRASDNRTANRWRDDYSHYCQPSPSRRRGRGGQRRSFRIRNRIPACSNASKVISSSARCCGSICFASLGEIPKKAASNPGECIGRAGFTLVRMQERIWSPAVGFDRGDQIVAGQECLPVGFVGTARQPKRETDHRYPGTSP